MHNKMKKSLLLYSKHHFDPAVGTELTASAGIIAKSLYDTLIRSGYEVTYVDPTEVAHFPTSHYDLFIGQPAGWNELSKKVDGAIKIIFMPTTHPLRRNRLIKAAAEKWQVKPEELLESEMTIKALEAADYIFQIGNKEAVQSLVENGIPREKIIPLHYGLPHIGIENIKESRPLENFIHLASGLGLRKGLPETLYLYEKFLKDKRLTLVGEFYKHEPNYEFWKEKVSAFEKKNINFKSRGYIPSDTEEYSRLLEQQSWLLYPSIEEGEPGTVIEAMSKGIVPLLTPSGSGINFSISDSFDVPVEKQLIHAITTEQKGWRNASDKARHYVEIFHNHKDWEERLSALWKSLNDKGKIEAPKASIVLSVFNKETIIEELLDKLWETTRNYKNFDLHIIFDGCKDRTEDRARNALKKYTVPVYEYITDDIFEIKTNNIGLKNATGEYCVLLQDDNFLHEEGWLEKIVGWMEQTPRAGIVGGLAGVNFFPLDANPQGLGAAKTPLEVYKRIDMRLEPKYSRVIQEVDAVMRGPLVLRKSLLERHGYLDESYAPLYNDDMDYCFRLRNLGYSVFHFPIGVENRELTVSHQDPSKKDIWKKAVERNQKLFYSRWEKDMGKHDHYIAIPLPESRSKRLLIRHGYLWHIMIRVKLLPKMTKHAIKRSLTYMPESIVLFAVKKLSQAGSFFTRAARNLHIYALQPRTIPWYVADGDHTLRVNYDLNENSVVFDMGGYEGLWAQEIYCKYGASIHIFEPVQKFADNIRNRFIKNSRVKVLSYGLGKTNQEIAININENASSTYQKSEYADKEVIKIRKADEYLKEQGITSIDLIKINIEGGEYDLLEAFIESGTITSLKNIQVQFHDFFPEAKERMKKIQDELKKTHRLTYHYEFVWENWTLK
jgi:FkbM family methyltransferase